MKQTDGGPIKTFGWQLAKAVLAAIVVIAYSRGMGAYGRGVVSILLLNLQMLLMVSELFAGGALANLLSKVPAKRILPSAWLFLLLLLIIGYVVGGFCYLLPNQGNSPLNVVHRNIISIHLLFFSVLFKWVLTQKIARQSWRSLLPRHVSTLLLAIALWVIIL